MASLAIDPSNVRVAIVDDHEAVRLGFAGMCAKSDLDLVGEAATVRELISKMNGLECQVVVMDLSLADGSLVAENVSQLIADIVTEGIKYAAVGIDDPDAVTARNETTGELSVTLVEDYGRILRKD